jgi:hypothetical protein
VELKEQDESNEEEKQKEQDVFRISSGLLKCGRNNH